MEGLLKEMILELHLRNKLRCLEGWETGLPVQGGSEKGLRT